VEVGEGVLALADEVLCEAERKTSEVAETERGALLSPTDLALSVSG
jgi:hypothetical protein